MLQNEKTRPFLEGVHPNDQTDQGGLGELVNFALGFLRRQYPVIIFVAALSLAASAIYLRVTPPTYKGQVKVLFGNPKAPFVQQQSMLTEPPIDTAQLETQIEILKSKAIAITVIKELRLAEDVDFQGSGGVFEALWRAISPWYGSSTLDAQARSQEPSMDWLVAEFQERLSALRLGFS